MDFFWQNATYPAVKKPTWLDHEFQLMKEWVESEGPAKVVVNVHGASGCGKTSLARSVFDEVRWKVVDVHPAECTRVDQVIRMLQHCETPVGLIVFMKDVGNTCDANMQRLAALQSQHKMVIISLKAVTQRRIKCCTIRHIEVHHPPQEVICELLERESSLPNKELRSLVKRCNYDLNHCFNSIRTGITSVKDEAFFDLSDKVQKMTDGRWIDEYRIVNIFSSTYIIQRAKHDIDTIFTVADAISACDFLPENYCGIIGLASKGMRINNMVEGCNFNSRKSMITKSILNARAGNISMYHQGHDPCFWHIWGHLLRNCKDDSTTKRILQPGWKIAFRVGDYWKKARASEKKKLEKKCTAMTNE